jgi:hypothetical protein
MAKEKITPRPLSEITREIRKDWKPMYRPAEAHFEAFEYADNVNQMYGMDSVKSEICYFLGNAQTWKGDVARRIKLELKALVGLK